MGRFIVKLGEWYFDWSTVVDAPVTEGMSRADFEEYYWREYGEHGMLDLPERMARVDAKGTSAYGYSSADEAIAGNRAGRRDACLTREGIIREYCAAPAKDASG